MTPSLAAKSNCSQQLRYRTKFLIFPCPLDKVTRARSDEIPNRATEIGEPAHA